VDRQQLPLLSRARDRGADHRAAALSATYDDVSPTELLAEVFHGSYRRLVVQLYGVTGSLGEAEDVVQEAFVRASSSPARFAQTDNPEAWLRTVALNLHRNRARKVRGWLRVRRVAEPPDPDLTDGLDDHLDVVRALRRLSAQQREVLALHYLADLPVAEVAETLGVPAGTVKSRLSRARAALNHLLEEDESDA
jgi:RNA polymerase sigma-70 factor (ECF subfamily)